MKLNNAAKKLLVEEFRKRKIKIIGFILLSILAGIIEAVGIGMIFPFIYLLVNPSMLHNFKILNWIMKIFRITNSHTLTIFLLASIVILITFKLSYLLFIRYLEMKMLSAWKTELATRLMQIYVYSSYEFYINKGTSWILKNISLIKIIYDQYVMSIFKICVASSIIIGLLSLLAIILPSGAIVACVIFSSLSVLIYKATKSYFNAMNEEAHIVYADRGKILTKSLGAIKETKVFGKESFFIDIFREIESRNYSNQHKYSFLSSLPPLVVEVGIMIGIMVLILFYLYNHRHGEALAVLSVLLMVMFRALPQVNKLLVSVQLINRSTDNLNTIAEELDLYEKESKEVAAVNSKNRLPLKEKIILSNVFYRYKKNQSHEYAITNVNAVIKKGQFVGITGHSAAGKTTLINLLLGLLPPTQGDIIIDNDQLNTNVLKRKWLNNIGYVPQSIYILEDSIVSNVAYGLKKEEINLERVYEVMRMASLSDLLDKGDYLYQMLGENGVQLSGGQRQRIGIARALYHNPDILILDEATANIDIACESDILNILSSLLGAKTIIMITHRLFTLTRCQNILVLDQGEIKSQGTFSELSERSEVFKNLLKKTNSISRSVNATSAVAV